MVRTWGKLIKNNRIQNHETISTEYSPNSDDNLNLIVEQLCDKLDISRPLILSKNIKEMIKFGQTKFFKDDFIETIHYDRFELEILREERRKRK